MIVASPKTAPKYPWYLPRSRGGMMSPTTAIVTTISPPPPSPWRARKAISCSMFWLRPQSAELAVDRADDRRGEQVGGDDPRELGEPAEVADDRRQRGRDDRLVERGEQQHEHQRREDQADSLGLWLRRHAG